MQEKMGKSAGYGGLAQDSVQKYGDKKHPGEWLSGVFRL